MMKRTVRAAVAALSLVAASASPAAAADKAHQQLMAEIRMLQEQAQQLAAQASADAHAARAAIQPV